MSDVGESNISIANRIKHFSGTVDSNCNNVHKKPSPVPRRRPQTEEINYNIGLHALRRSSSDHSITPKKPAVPTKPVPAPKTSQIQTSPQMSKPQVATRGRSPRPASTPVSPNLEHKAVGELNTNKKRTNKTLENKPKLPTKPNINLLDGKGFGTQVKSLNSEQSSWKQTAGPPKKPVPFGPSKVINQPATSPAKPPRGRERSVYENHEVETSKNIKNIPNDISERVDTLDGMTFGVPKSYHNTHIKAKQQQSAPATTNVPFTSKPYGKQHIANSSSRAKSTSAVDDDYDYVYEGVKSRTPIVSKKNLYDQADPHAVQGFMKSIQSNDSDDLYEDPDTVDFCSNNQNKCAPNADTNSQEDYEEPPDAKGPLIHIKDASSDDDNDDYDMPDSYYPPPVPMHKNKSNKDTPPPVPGHKNVSDDNNITSSSSDEDACPNYTDPDSYFSKPPVPIYKQRLGSMRRGSNVHFQPAEYMPVCELVPEIDSDDELIRDSSYIDPAIAFPTSPTSKVRIKADDEQIYSDEPLYQVYNAEVNEEHHRLSKKKDDKENNNICPDILHGGKSIRMLWEELPAVRTSGFLESITDEERKRQEAMFEVITSEASYLKSLDILVSHFMLNKEFLPNPRIPSADTDEKQMLDRQQYHFLFTGISAIKSVSERFLKDLRRRQQESILISTISDIISDYAQNNFHCYVKYCSNKVFQDRTLTALLHSNAQFADVLSQLEANPICQGLSMQSFLTLPMQRITRLPLLVDAICSRCEPGSDEFHATDKALNTVNVLVHESNEGARKMERTEEMYFIQKTLTFKTKPIPLISSSRWLVKRGDVMCLHEDGRFSKYRNQIRQIFKGKCKPVYLFLFTDIVLVTKMKNDEHFKVIDYCTRPLLKVEVLPHIPDPEPPKVGTLATIHINPLKYAFTIILLENSNSKTVDYHCFLSTETDKTRWLEAFNPPKESLEIAGESIYDEWDCPQVQVIHPYQAEQSDEITLIEGDVIKVLRKLPDGWAEGLRLRDDEKGWFPINHTDEIDSKHIRAKNLMQRYRLVTASKNIVSQILGK